MKTKKNYEQPISDSIEIEGNLNIMEGTTGTGGWNDPSDGGNNVAPANNGPEFWSTDDNQ